MKPKSQAEKNGSNPRTVSQSQTTHGNSAAAAKAFTFSIQDNSGRKLESVTLDAETSHRLKRAAAKTGTPIEQLFAQIVQSYLSAL
jgi:hypothetical protein